MLNEELKIVVVYDLWIRITCIVELKSQRIRMRAWRNLVQGQDLLSGQWFYWNDHGYCAMSVRTTQEVLKFGSGRYVGLAHIFLLPSCMGLGSTLSHVREG